VCDQPHPLLIQSVIRHTLEGNIDEAYKGLKQLSDLGYSASDIITTLFRVVKNFDMAEYLKLEYIRVPLTALSSLYLIL
jgi:replication factor C subunit 2/4